MYRTLFTEEAQFTGVGINKSPNSHIWAGQNPHAICDSCSYYRFSENVWIVLDRQLIRPYFSNTPLIGATYLNFLKNIWANVLANVAARGIYLMNDGASPYFSIAVHQHLHASYDNRWIGRGVPHTWSTRSPAFIPVDNFI